MRQKKNSKTSSTTSPKEFRRITTHYGIRAKFRESGEFGHFSLFSFLRFVASCISLLSLPHAIVDKIFPLVIETFGKRINKKNEEKINNHQESSSSVVSYRRTEKGYVPVVENKNHNFDVLGLSAFSAVEKPEWWDDYILDK